jgi:hypothetical protein
MKPHSIRGKADMISDNQFEKATGFKMKRDKVFKRVIMVKFLFDDTKLQFEFPVGDLIRI